MGRKKASDSHSQEKPSSSNNLKTLIEKTSLFLDDLVKLIPPRFYVPGPDDDDRPWFQGLSKAAKASAKKQARENIKKARRLHFNPDNPSSTLDFLQKSIKSDQNPNDDDAAADGSDNPTPKPEEQSVTYEELRERLHRRIEELRSGRNTCPKNEPRNDQRKRKREPEEKSEREEKKEKKKDESLADLTFGKVKIGDEDEKRKKKKKRISKAQELERAKRLEELKKDPEKGEIVSKKHSWKAAESRAMGVKVHDDPKLLRESIKKERKRQKKHAEKWNERVEGRENARKEKQKTRMDNIEHRIHQKKMRRIEKREKKLMRPGFEGRKEGYLNE